MIQVLGLLLKPSDVALHFHELVGLPDVRPWPGIHFGHGHGLAPRYKKSKCRAGSRKGSLPMVDSWVSAKFAEP